MLQTIFKDIYDNHAATILQIILQSMYFLIFLLPSPGFEPAFLHRWAGAGCIDPTPYPSSLAIFLFDDDVDGAPMIETRAL